MIDGIGRGLPHVLVLEDVVLSVGLKDVEPDHVGVRPGDDAGAGALRLGDEIAAARDDVLLAGAELAHARAGLRHAADLDPVEHRTPEQRVLRAASSVMNR